MPYQPLNGIRLLDFSRLLPGPYLTQLLADLGAEVIKVETLGAGDYARMAPPEVGLGGLFEAVNQNKKSLAVNYRKPEGREILYRLVQEVDVFIEGFRPGAVKRRKLDYETIKAINPQIIYCSLSGYGQSGPFRNRAGHDLNYIAVGGALELNGPADGPPIPPGVPIADLSGGMLGAIAILAALIDRQTTGEGAYLDIALLDGVISWITPLAGGQYFSTGKSPQRGHMPLAGGLACYNVYQTRDGKYLSLSALEPHFWGNFCTTLGREDLIARQFDPELKPELEVIFRQRTREEWVQLFTDRDVCLEPVNSFDELLAHPQVRHRGYVQEKDGQPVSLRSPFIFARGDFAPAPQLGEHTSEILAKLGYEQKMIEELAAAGVIKLG